MSDKEKQITRMIRITDEAKRALELLAAQLRKTEKEVASFAIIAARETQNQNEKDYNKKEEHGECNL